jgi:hypothetical protein
MQRAIQRATGVAFLVLSAACSGGEPCDVATYEGGCDGKRAWTRCTDEHPNGVKKLRATVDRRECRPNTECAEAGGDASCVAEPAQRCDTPNASRCVNGLNQVCWEMRKGHDRTGLYFWFLLEGGCVPAEP